MGGSRLCVVGDDVLDPQHDAARDLCCVLGGYDVVVIACELRRYAIDVIAVLILVIHHGVPMGEIEFLSNADANSDVIAIGVVGLS